MGAKCPTCGGRENVIVDGTSRQVRPDRFHREAREKFDREAAATPPAPAPADDASGAEAMRELDAMALLIAKAHGALFIDGGPGSVAFRADLNAARALTHDAYEKIESVRAAIRALPPAPVDAVKRDAARFRWLMERNFGFAFDAERCGISTGRWGPWPESADEQRAMIDRAIAAEASSARDGKGGDRG